MMIPMRFAVGVSLAAALSGATARAHHAIPDYYDTTRTVALTGTVLGAGGPPDAVHRFILLEAKGPDGAVDRWVIETPPQDAMERAGMRLCPCPAGAEGLTMVGLKQTISVSVYVPKAGVNLATTLTDVMGPMLDEFQGRIKAGRFVHLADLTAEDGKKFSFAGR